VNSDIENQYYYSTLSTHFLGLYLPKSAFKELSTSITCDMQPSPNPQKPLESTPSSAPTSVQPELVQRDRRVKPIDAVTRAYGKIKRKKETDSDFQRENKRRNNARQAKYRQKKKEREKEAAEVVDSAAGNINYYYI
jgi:hypothetical protein